MRFWVFSIQTLSDALADFDARRKREGASDEQATDDRAVILNFLQGEEAEARKMFSDDGRG